MCVYECVRAGTHACVVCMCVDTQMCVCVQVHMHLLCVCVGTHASACEGQSSASSTFLILCFETEVVIVSSVILTGSRMTWKTDP